MNASDNGRYAKICQNNLIRFSDYYRRLDSSLTTWKQNDVKSTHPSQIPVYD